MHALKTKKEKKLYICIILSWLTLLLYLNLFLYSTSIFLLFLQDGYDDYALFFHDTYSGIVIGVLLKPAVFERKDFKVADVNCRKLDSNGKFV